NKSICIINLYNMARGRGKGYFAKSGPGMMVLVLLRERARYGYEIRDELERLSDKALTIQFGTLYPILSQLEKDGLIAGAWEQPEGERMRRIYALTETGRTEVEQQVEAWNRYSMAVNQVI